MNRVATAAAALALVLPAAGVVACGGSSKPASNSASGSKTAGTATPAAATSTPSTKPVTLSVWVGWSARELKVFKSVVAEYEKQNPNVTVNVTGSINDNKIVAAIRA